MHRGAVHAVKPFGVFVVIPGFRRRGLVPLHQVSAYLSVPREASDEEKVAALSEALGSDPEVWFKVVEVQPDDGDGRGAKVACSIKNVAQHDGRDLDPHNLNYRPRGGGDAGRGGRGGADPGTLPAAHQLAGFAREEMALRVKGPAKGGRGEGYELLLEPEGGEEGAGPPPPRGGARAAGGAGVPGGRPPPAAPDGARVCSDATGLDDRRRGGGADGPAPDHQRGAGPGGAAEVRGRGLERERKLGQQGGRGGPPPPSPPPPPQAPKPPRREPGGAGLGRGSPEEAQPAELARLAAGRRLSRYDYAHSPVGLASLKLLRGGG